MKLFYFPGACSMGAHIAAHEAGISLEAEAVDLKTKALASGGDFTAVNPKGYVPALLLDDGQLLTESAVILQYIADGDASGAMLPPVGTLARYRVLEMVNFIATELHKGLGPLLDATLPDANKAAVKVKIGGRLALIEDRLGSNAYLAAEDFTIADAYAFPILNAARRFGMDFAPFPRIAAYLDRLAARPAVQATMAAEGLTG